MPVRSPVLRALALALVAAVAACSLLVDTEGLSGGDVVPSSGRDDGETPTPTPTPTPNRDGSVDAPAMTYCETLATSLDGAPDFCCDFDNDGGCPLAFESLVGTYAITNTDPRSSPAAIEFNVPELDVDGSQQGTWATAVAKGPYNKMKLAFALDSIVAGVGRTKIAGIVVAPAKSAACAVSVQIEDGPTLTIEESGPLANDDYGYNQPNNTRRPIVKGAWVHVELVVDVDARTFSLSVDGAPVAANRPLTTWGRCDTTGIPQGFFGARYFNRPSTERQLRIDDVTLDALL